MGEPFQNKEIELIYSRGIYDKQSFILAYFLRLIFDEIFLFYCSKHDVS
jgi:hypothetical protein